MLKSFALKQKSYALLVLNFKKLNNLFLPTGQTSRQLDWLRRPGEVQELHSVLDGPVHAAQSTLQGWHICVEVSAYCAPEQVSWHCYVVSSVSRK
jgi:hypothetical protein